MIYTLVKKGVGDNIESVFSFDCITSFDEEWSATVTTQTVEYGFNITDNINIEAPTYNIQAILSSYSLFSPEKEIVWDGEGFNPESTTSLEDSHIIARDSLINLFKSRAILTVIESKANSSNPNLEVKVEDLKSGYNNEINNCILTSLSISNPSNATDAFLVALKIQKINVATVSVLELTKEEMNPLLKGLVVKPTTTASKAKGENGEDIDDGSVALQESETFTENVEGVRDGMGWHDVYDQKTKELKVIKDRTAAEEEMGDHIALTKQFCKLVQRSDGYYKRCRPT